MNSNTTSTGISIFNADQQPPNKITSSFVTNKPRGPQQPIALSASVQSILGSDPRLATKSQSVGDQQLQLRQSSSSSNTSNLHSTM